MIAKENESLFTSDVEGDSFTIIRLKSSKNRD